MEDAAAASHGRLRMAVKERSFWSSTSGVVTGVAGTLTGIVGIVGIATQAGWIGSGGDTGQSATKQADGADTTTSTTASSDSRTSGVDQRAGRSATTAGASFTVDPSALSFEALGARTASVTLKNTGRVEMNVEDITVDGGDEDRFTVAAPCTQASIEPGRSCAVDVSFTPGGSGTARATMVIEVEDAPAEEVPLSGSSLL